MLKIRLKRIGKKHDPQYRIIIIPARTKRDGRAVEYIGYYNPISKEIKLKVERAKYWLSTGAQPTDTVRSILVKHKLLKKRDYPKRPPRKPKKDLKEQGKEDKGTIKKSKTGWSKKSGIQEQKKKQGKSNIDKTKQKGEAGKLKPGKDNSSKTKKESKKKE